MAEFFQDGVGFAQRARRYIAAKFSCSGHGQDVAEVLAGADGGGVDVDFEGGHQDGREADIFRGQADDEERAGRTKAGKG